MSFCRIGEGSDVYAYPAGPDRVEVLTRTTIGEGLPVAVPTRADAVRLLELLGSLGLRVPEAAMARLRSEAEERRPGEGA